MGYFIRILFGVLFGLLKDIFNILFFKKDKNNTKLQDTTHNVIPTIHTLIIVMLLYVIFLDIKTIYVLKTEYKEIEAIAKYYKENCDNEILNKNIKRLLRENDLECLGNNIFLNPESKMKKIIKKD